MNPPRGHAFAILPAMFRAASIALAERPRKLRPSSVRSEGRAGILKRIGPLALMFAVTVCAQPTLAYADGLSDMKAALLRLKGGASIKAEVESKTWSGQDVDKDTTEHEGLISVTVEDNQRGFSVLLSKDLLTKLEAEERAKEQDKKAKTPTLAALGAASITSLRPLVSAATSIASMIEGTAFKAERMDSFDGKPVRMLSFEHGIDSLPEEGRKYVKKLSGLIDIWIAADGTPLASRKVLDLHGRAFLVATFDSKDSDEKVYNVIGDRLVVVKHEHINTSTALGHKSESRDSKTVKIVNGI